MSLELTQDFARAFTLLSEKEKRKNKGILQKTIKLVNYILEFNKIRGNHE